MCIMNIHMHGCVYVFHVLPNICKLTMTMSFYLFTILRFNKAYINSGYNFLPCDAAIPLLDLVIARYLDWVFRIDKFMYISI